MLALKIVEIIALIALLGGVGWALWHWRRIRRNLAAHEAIPKSAPGSNLLVLLTTLLVVFIFLLSYLIAHT